MNTEWKELKGIVAIGDAVAAGMEIHENFTLYEWDEWGGFRWYADRKYRARHRKPKVETFDDQIDAARYRWLRDVAYNASAGPSGEMIWCVTSEGCGKAEPIFGTELDAAIDEAIGAAKQPAKVQVKSLCWRDPISGALFWWDEFAKVPDVFKRFPAGDISGGVVSMSYLIPKKRTDKAYVDTFVAGVKRVKDRHEAENAQCPVCGFYCIGNGGVGCIDKPAMVAGDLPGEVEA